MPPTHLPTPSDIPQSLNPIFHPPSTTTTTSTSPSPSEISNTTLFLPGLGDTSPNFSSFPRALSLPSTLSITLQPPTPLPLGLTAGPSYHWSDDLQISTTGDLDGTDSGFDRSTTLVVDLIVDVLLAKCGFRGEEIHVVGFGQGGSLAVVVALAVYEKVGVGLGSVVSIGGPLSLGVPVVARQRRGGKCGTPVLMVGGARGAVFGAGGESMLKRVRERFEFVETERWKRGDDGMPRNREEVLPLMRFWGRRLRSRKGVPDGAIEVG